MSKKILVTGGAGYIGSHTAVEISLAGYEPVLIDNFSKSDRSLLDGIERITGRRVSFYEGDCMDYGFLKNVFQKENSFDCVMHFAAFKSVGESVQKPLFYYRNNIDSLITLLSVMSEYEVRNFVFSSSCTVYGQPASIPVDESTPFKRAESPYGATKQMCERILEDVYPSGFKVISLRYFNPIGAHPSAEIGELPIGTPNNLVPYITQTAIGKRKQLTIFGFDYDTEDGSCIRDFIHVVDLAKAHVSAMKYLNSQPDNSFYDVFNLGTGLGVSVLKLVNEFIEVTGASLNYTLGPRRPGDVEKVFSNPAKANALLKWHAQYSTRDALSHAWEWEKRLAGSSNS